MNVFLDSVRTSASSFRADAIRAGRDLRRVESEFNDLKQRTCCLLRGIDPPPRDDNGKHELHVKEVPPRKLVVRDRVDADDAIRRARANTPVTVMSFRTEKLAAIRAGAPGPDRLHIRPGGRLRNSAVW
jgi:hypothetical protein